MKSLLILTSVSVLSIFAMTAAGFAQTAANPASVATPSLDAICQCECDDGADQIYVNEDAARSSYGRKWEILGSCKNVENTTCTGVKIGPRDPQTQFLTLIPGSGKLVNCKDKDSENDIYSGFGMVTK